LVVGLTGPNACGKGEVATHLARQGYAFHSLSDIVREEAQARGLPPEREHLIRIGQELRRAEGPGVLAERLLPRLTAKAVVDSIRAPAEVAVLRSRPDFRLVAVDAPVEVRWRRAVERQRAGDATDLESFKAQEELENRDDPAAQQVLRTMEMADSHIVNDGTIEQLHDAIDRLVASWE
jgi:dephospho-CoA kinase